MIGERHVFKDGTSFYETLFGPMVQGQCVDCQAQPMTVAYPFNANVDCPIRCNNCARRAHGLPYLEYVTPSTLVESVSAPVCRFASGSLFCVNDPCPNPGHRT
jgi:hypothetical protein